MTNRYVLRHAVILLTFIKSTYKYTCADKYTKITIVLRRRDSGGEKVCTTGSNIYLYLYIYLCTIYVYVCIMEDSFGQS